MSVTPRTRRIDRGNTHYYELDGERADGVTKTLDKGMPKPALVGWAANVTADYATDHWDELNELRPSQRNAVLRRCRWEVTDSAKRRGSEVHDYARRLAAGQDVDVPEGLTGHVDAYLRFVAEWQPAELLVETICGHRYLRYMGTFDLIAQLADGRVWLLDWKTGGKGVYPEAALQLAAYRYAEFYLDADGAEHPMPKVDATGVVWLRDDGYDLYPVETDADIFAVFMHAQHVARFVGDQAELVIGEALLPPERTAAA